MREKNMFATVAGINQREDEFVEVINPYVGDDEEF